ncbi:hypothetical protein K1720_00245 [Thermococcus argininiproducens]|uniref:Uncharacterized protein n=1 Tax=Thermococcus argininiproducens TaxID=2866384 RepID=A0A9E7MAK3_9EURY|nr:hypothetical protein [Thermococcus argininiproducens]USG99957.1 hypothetical protein K1720_00245 [Thermococcus argininiproducens]
MIKLPESMEKIWTMRAKEMREVEIAETLEISRQAVNKALKDAKAKLFEAFFALAETFSWEIIRVNAEKGFMVAKGKCKEKDVRVYAFYIPKKGIKGFFDEDIPDYIIQHALGIKLIKKPDKKELIKVLET